jgi:hypothetical protein
MIDASEPAPPDLVDIDFVAGVYRAELGSRPVLYRSSGQMRSPLMARRSEASIPPAEVIPVELPPIRELVGPLVWVLIPALPILLRVGWQSALAAAMVALMVRQARHIANRSTISFGEGFLGYTGMSGWPHGVQEDNDVHWNWSASRPATPRPGAGG